jgi:sulfoxide reductase heme-binding subunit YedZ
VLSRKTETTDKNRQSLLLLSSVGGSLLLILFFYLAGAPLIERYPELINLAQQAVARNIPQSGLAILADQAQAMSIPLESGSKAFWYLARAGGIVSYILLWLASCWGIMMSSKVIKGYINFASAYALHEFLPLLGIVFAALHALVLLGDSFIGFNLQQILIPFTSTYEPFWTGLGSLAFYLFLAIVLSSYLRKQIGQKSWRIFHYTSYLAFLFALVHGLMAGTDSDTLAVRLLYIVTGGITLFLIYYRVLSHSPKSNHAHKRRSLRKDSQINA